MPDDFDINRSRIIDGEPDIETPGREILDKVVKAASGEKTRGEVFGYGVSEYAPWQSIVISR